MTTHNKKYPSLLKLSTIAMLATSFGVGAAAQSDEVVFDGSSTSVAWASEKVAPKSVDLDLRSIPTVTPWQVGDAIKDMPRRRFAPDFVEPGAPKNPVAKKEDQLMKRQSKHMESALADDVRALQQTIDGAGFTGVNPPDPTGDVGLNYYIQSINGNIGSIFSIYDKNNGSLVAGPINMETLGSGQCASGAGDPIVLFDDMAQRWMLSEFSSSGNNLCVYISKTSDPVSGGWYAYAFASPTFPDYPKYGIGPDAYYVGTNENNPTVYALNRAAMLNGQSANFVRLTASKLAGFGFQMITPVDADGATAMPQASSGYFVRHRDDEVHNSGSNNPNQDYIELWKFNADFNTTSNSSFTKESDIAVADFDSSLCGLTSFSCFPQSGSSSDMDPLREVMFRVQYRNFGSYEMILGNFVTDVNGADHGGIRWFELRRSGAGSWALHQEGTYSPDSKNRWMGSVAMDKDGNIALAYSWGSSSDYPGLRYTGRNASDPSGVMSQAEAVLVNGTSGVSSNRWGDYSHMAVDPVDGCTFWYTNEYGKSGGQWGTHISKFKFDTCGGSGGGNVSPSASFSFNCNELACSFNGSASSDPDGSISSYAWDFGDGSSGSGVSPSHTYAADGTYSVKLTVTDNLGASGQTLQSVTATSTTPIDNTLENGVAKTNLSGATASSQYFTLEVPAGATNLNFAMSGGTGDADMYVRFGSQPTSSVYDCRPYKSGNAESCPISNVQAGTYHVMIYAYSAYSGVSLTGSYDLVTNTAPTAAFTHSCSDLACSFNGSGSSDAEGAIASYAWNFGDGTTGSGATPSHAYSAAGTYTAQLTVTDAGGLTGSTSKSVTVTVTDTGSSLQNGVAKTGLTANTGSDLFYTLDVPAGASGLTFVMTGGSGDADMYVKFGSQPTSTSYDCRPYKTGNEETCTISNVQAGTYYVMVKAYSTFSGVSLTASYSTGGGSTGGSMSKTNLSASKSNWLHYTVEVPAGMSTLTVNTSGGSGDADLYVRAGSQPTTSAYDCRPYKTGNTESCTINSPTATTWYISLRAYSTFSGVNLTAEWQ